MLKYLEPLDWLPTAEDLPDSDETPVDNELQELAPTLLKLILSMIWADRTDWFMGIDMGLYYSPDEPPIVPDAFISLGVESVKSEDLRSSYVLWEEKGILPQLALEVVSTKYRGEYSTKKALYEQLGVLYYVVYNAKRKRKPTLEVYKLIQGKYLPMVGFPLWMPELQLGLGKERRSFQGRDREWLFWYDAAGDRYLMPDERIAAAETRTAEAETRTAEAETKIAEAETKTAEAETRTAEAETRAGQAEVRLQQLADRLRELGIDPGVI
jgi:Uma2 family endonuclease